MIEPVRLVASGDAAMIAEFDERIDPDVNGRAVALSSALAREPVSGVRDVVPTFRSVAVYFDPLLTDTAHLSTRLRELARSLASEPPPPGSIVDIPVCYGDDFGPDLARVAEFAHLAVDEVVARHVGRQYRAYMVGFLPGFAYLGSVDERIAAPRRESPRRAVAVGSVGIAGVQTGVYPRTSPGGWNIIGRTPTAMFDWSRPRPSLLRPGDRVQFRAIDRAEFDRLSSAREVRP